MNPVRVKVPQFELVQGPSFFVAGRHPRNCPVCGLGIFLTPGQLRDHVSSATDDEHAVWEVMDS